MKKHVRLFLAVLVVFLVSLPAFCISEANILSCEYAGTADWDEFEEIASDMDSLYEGMVQEFGGEDAILEFFEIDEDKADDEDYEVLDLLEAYLDEYYYIEDGVVYTIFVIRDIYEDTMAMDGWIIFAYYSEEDECFIYYMYYYACDLNYVE